MALLKGRIAYIQDNSAYIETADGTGKPARLPGSAGVSMVTVSPTDGSALYFVFLSGMPFDPLNQRDESQRPFLCSPPYNTATTFPPPVDRTVLTQAFWTGDGSAAVIRSGTAVNSNGFIFFPKKKALQPLPFPFAATSQDAGWGVGRLTPGGGIQEIRLWGIPPRKEKVLFENRNAGVLDAALLAAQFHPMPLKGPARSRSWSVAPPTLTPDGKTVYFLAHDGTGHPYHLFAADVETGKIRALVYQFGDPRGRTHPLSISPDGKRLLWEEEKGEPDFSGNAVVVDLATRKTLLTPTEKDPERKGGTRRPLTAGACWSPDGQHFAVSVGYFTPRGKSGGAPLQYDIHLCESATGRTVRVIKNALRPSWGA